MVGLADESVIVTLWNQVYCIQNIGSRKDREHPSENFAFLFERFTEVFVHGVVEEDVREDCKDAQQNIKGTINIPLFASVVVQIFDMCLAAVVVIVVVDFQTNEVKSHNPRNKGNHKSEKPHSLKICFCIMLYLGSALIFANLYKLFNLICNTNDQILHRGTLENSDVKR